MTTTLNRDQRDALHTIYTEQTKAVDEWLEAGDPKRANRAQGVADGIVRAVAIITETDEGAVYTEFMAQAEEAHESD